MSLSSEKKGSRAVTQISQEIWDMIISDLPPPAIRRAASIFKFKLLPEFQKHHAVWEAIFKDETWITQISAELKLNPVLIGPDLESLYDGKKKEYKETRYLVLTVNARDVKTSQALRRSKDLFESCLQPHRVFDHDEDDRVFIKAPQEYNLVSEIRLNVDGIFNLHQCGSDRSPGLFHDLGTLENGFIRVNAQRFLTNKEKLFYLFWQDRRNATRTTGRADLDGCYSRRDLSNGPEYVVLLYLKSSEGDRETYGFIPRNRRFRRSDNYEMWGRTVVGWLREDLHPG